jgi:RNA polymerase sigma-70 factor (ECF subfamily)
MQQHVPEPHLADSERENAFAAFYQVHALAVLAYLRLHTSSPEEAEDLLLEVFVAALEQQTLLSRDAKVQCSWLFHVAHNKLVDSYRRKGRQTFVPLDTVAEHLYEDDARLPEQVALQHEQEAQLSSVLNSLSPLQRQVVQLRFIYGLKCSEIAHVLGKKEAAVRKLLTRSLNLVRILYTQK